MMRRFMLILVGVVFAHASSLAGDVEGKVVFKGTAPKAARIFMSGDPRCTALHKDPVYTEDVIVNPNGTLRNVIVSVKSGLASKKYDVPRDHVVLDQRGCQYIPHVIAIMAGQDLQIVNDDPTLHNVHTLSTLNPAFNIAQPKQGMKLDRSFNRPEFFKVKCEVHPWMAAYIGVFESPYFSVTGDDGSFVIKGLPPGEYTLEAWHERYGTRTMSVKVPAKGAVSISFDYSSR